VHLVHLVHLVLLAANSSSAANSEESVRHFRLIEAIRSADFNALNTILQQVNPEQSTFGTPLHLAASFAPKAVVEYLMKAPFRFNVNAQDLRGNTALHLASKAGRAEIVDMIMKAPQVDCSKQNEDGKDCRSVAKSKDVLAIIDRRFHHADIQKRRA
jgi:ankyrin repeat protein